jgi:hypothetical protein
MEYTELAEYPLSDGLLTTWLPTCAEAAWLDDERGLSHDHEAHLGDAQPGSWIGSVLRIPLRYDAGALRRALRAWINRHEALRTTVRPGSVGWQRRSVAVGEVDVLAREHGTVTAARAAELISEFFASVSPTVWPHCVFATVECEDDDAFFVAFGADHSVMDAYSQLLWFEEFVSLYVRSLDGDPDGEMGSVDVGSHVDHSAASRSLAAVVDTEDPAVALWREFLATPEGYRFPAYPGLAPTGGETRQRQHSLSRWVLDPVRAHRIETVCRNLGTGTQSGALAALGLAVHALTGSGRLRIVMPMHTRHDRRHANAVGWYVGLCPVDVDVVGSLAWDQSGNFGAAVRAARAAVSESRGCAKTSFARIAQILGIEGEPRFVASYVDVRGIAGADRWAGWNARALRSPEPSRDEVYLWIIHSEHGVNVSARCARSDQALAAVEDLISEFGNLLTAVADEDSDEIEVGA